MKLSFLWQLPQIILAKIIYFYLKKKIITTQHQSKTIYITDTPGWGISLGEYVFLDKNYDTKTLYHELGHCKQSMIFGPLYLIVIGIPSAVFNNLWDRLFHKKWSNRRRRNWYYSRFPEKWADKLGGVDRG